MNDVMDTTDAIAGWEVRNKLELEFDLSVTLNEEDAETIQQLVRNAYKQGLDAGVDYAITHIKQMTGYLENAGPDSMVSVPKKRATN